MKGGKNMNLINVAKNFLKDKSIKLDVVEEFVSPTVARYDPVRKSIFINNSMFNPEEGLSRVDFLYVILCHEIGHYLDNDLDKLMKKIGDLQDKIYTTYKNGSDYDEVMLNIKEMEINAWEKGRPLVPEHLTNQYEIINKASFERGLATKSKMIMDDLTKRGRSIQY
jgi:hypothetical protein